MPQLGPPDPDVARNPNCWAVVRQKTGFPGPHLSRLFFGSIVFCKYINLSFLRIGFEGLYSFFSSKEVWKFRSCVFSRVFVPKPEEIFVLGSRAL